MDRENPTMFANAFRSPDAGDLVPISGMVHEGVDVGMLRRDGLASIDDPWLADRSGREDEPFYDINRNPYMAYQPMTRLGNLLTNRSNVFAVWITVGYFEVEPAPDWNDPDDDTREAIRARFGGDTPAARALYDRVYPEGYALGAEVGSDTGNLRRHRGFYVIDRTEPVGFKPGEDLNVERTIRVRRRIE